MKIFIRLFILVILAITQFAQVGNPDKPIRGKWDFQLKKIWGIEKAGDVFWGEIQNIRAAKDGRIYIADSKNLKIFILSKDGKYISSFGSEGEGPGEIMSYGSGDQLFIVNDNIIFGEWGKVQYFSLDGKYKKTVLMESNLKPRAFISEDIFITASSSIEPDTQQEKSKIMLYNVKDKSKKIISEFQPYAKAIAGNRQMSVRIVIPNITPMVFVTSKNSKVYYGMSDLYKINIVSLDSKEIGSFTINGRKRKEVSAVYKEGLKKELGNIPGEIVDKILNGLPDEASFFQDLWIAENGLVFIYVSDPNNRNLQAFDIFSPEGRYLYSAEIKFEKEYTINLIHFAGGFLYISITDEEGTTTVNKYEIKLPVL